MFDKLTQNWAEWRGKVYFIIQSMNMSKQDLCLPSRKKKMLDPVILVTFNIVILIMDPKKNTFLNKHTTSFFRIH